MSHLVVVEFTDGTSMELETNHPEHWTIPEQIKAGLLTAEWWTRATNPRQVRLVTITRKHEQSRHDEDTNE